MATFSPRRAPESGFHRRPNIASNFPTIPGAGFGDGWVVLFSEAFDWADAERVLALSRFGLTVGCQFEDKVDMTSIACACRDGVELWRVSHANDPNHRLDVTGDPPAQFAEIRDRLLRDQEEDGGEESDVDYLHDVPLDLARSVCGYRADEDRSVFVGLRPAGTSPQPSPKPAPGMVGKLLAMFGRR